MSYQVLARRWRPQGFDEVTGQAHVTAPLRNALRTDRVPHALLLCGPRGVGKTTLARILARCLNCEKGPTETPCGTCTSCTEIAEGRSTDVQEIDAASRTSVDDVRDLIEAVRYAPSPGKHRIFVVDEVHMLSTAAFNALLKTLEEPPPRSLFVFCTTNPEKIPFTVVSRCQRYDLRRIAASEIAARLAEVSRAEGVEISEASLGAIARESEGSLRDALTLLDQVIASSGSQVDDARVAEILDLVDRRLLLAVAEACVDGDPAAALAAFDRAADAGADPRRLGGALLAILRDLTVLRVAPDADLVEGSDAELAELRALAERTEDARLRRMFRALLREQEDLAWAPHPGIVLEMALVRLATMPSGDDVSALLARLETLERQLAGAPGSGPAPSSGGGSNGSASQRSGRGSRPARKAPSGGRTDAAPDLETAPPAEPASPAPRVEGREDAPTPGAQRAEAERSPQSDASPAPRVGQREDAPPPGAQRGEGERSPQSDASPATEGEHEDEASPPGAQRGEAEGSSAVTFDQLRRFAQEHNRGLFAALEGGRLAARTDVRLRVVVPEAFAARRLEARRREFEEVCERFFGRRLQVEIACDGPEPPSAERRAEESDLARRRRQQALDHPAVNDALQILGGEIVEIRPLGGAGGAGGPGERP